MYTCNTLTGNATVELKNMHLHIKRPLKMFNIRSKEEHLNVRNMPHKITVKSDSVLNKVSRTFSFY